MAIIHNNAAFNSIRGRVGDLVFRTYNGKTIVSRRPQRSTKPPTPAQLANQARFAALARERAYQRWLLKQNSTDPK
jgi:hypothetical protein